MSLVKALMRFNVALCLFVLLSSNIFSQVSDIISGVKITPAREGQDVRIRVEFLSSNLVENITLAYKTFGAGEYRFQEMVLSSSSASAVIPAAYVQQPGLEYYFLISGKGGVESYYPFEALTGNVLQETVVGVDPKDSEIIILSPEPGQVMTQEDALITVSLLKANDNVDKAATKVFINEVNVTNLVVFADDLLILLGSSAPQLFSAGKPLVLRIELYDNTGKYYHGITQSFSIQPTGFRNFGVSAVKYNMRLRGESRNESVNAINNWYNNVGLDGTVDYEGFTLESNLYITSEEKGNLQPNNRYRVSLKHDYFEIHGGDYIPDFPTLIMSGKRVRGISGQVSAGFFNLHATYGEINRGIDGRIIEILPQGTVALGTDLFVLPDSSLARVNFGTYKRNLFAVRPSFHAGETFKFGLSYLHSKDDLASSQIARTAQENLVVGTDLALSFDDQRIQITGQGAFSVVNKDITTGTLSNERIDQVFAADGTFKTNPEDIKKLKDIISQFITFNQFITPLKPEELSTLAYETALSLNYFDNYIRASYIYRGFDFVSFGNNFTRNDVAGINIVDRLRLFENKLFIQAGYEQLKDNRQGNKLSTTTYTTLNFSVSYYPSYSLPNFSIGYTRNANKNTLDLIDPIYGIYAVDDAVNRFSFQINHRFNLGIDQNVSLSTSYAKRDDNSLRKINSTSLTLLLATNQNWDKDLTSFLNFNYSGNEIAGTDFVFYSFSLGARYFLMNRDLVFNASFNPYLGDITRYGFDAGAQYFIYSNFSLNLQFRYLLNDLGPNDSVIGLSTRYDLF